MSTSPAAPSAPGATAPQSPAQPAAATRQPTPSTAQPAAVGAQAVEQPKQPINHVDFTKALAAQRAATKRNEEAKAKAAEVEKAQAAVKAREAELAPLLEIKGLMDKGDPLAVATKLAGGEDKLEDFLAKLSGAVVSARGKGGRSVTPEVQAKLDAVDALKEELESLKKERASEKAEREQAAAKWSESQQAAAGEKYLADGWESLKAKGADFELVLKPEFSALAQDRIINKLVAMGQQRAKETRQGAQVPPLTPDDYRNAASEVESELLNLQVAGLTTAKVKAKLKESSGTTATPTAASPKGQPPKTVTSQRGDAPVTTPGSELLSPKKRMLAFKQGWRPS